MRLKEDSMINELREINKRIIDKSNNADIIYKHNIIANLLDYDNCFFNISIDQAFSILYDLHFSKEEALNVYKKLISIDNFNNLND